MMPASFDTAIHGLTMLIDARLETDLARYSADAVVIVLPASNDSNVQPTSFDHTSRVVGEARADARALLACANRPSPGCRARRGSDRGLAPGRQEAARTRPPRVRAAGTM
jgi:hypothetical protein